MPPALMSILAALAPGLRYDQLARKATAVAMKLDAEAFKRGKEKARQERQRARVLIGAISYRAPRW